jgi:hypothetical protein
MFIFLLDSWAARTQRAIGNIEVGSPLALAQSIGMGGGVPLYGIVAGGVILGTISLLLFVVVRCVARNIPRLYQAIEINRLFR